MTRVRRIAALLLCGALLGCSGREPNNPARLTLVNRTDRPVSGAVLRFDRELARVDRVGDGNRGGFGAVRLRMNPADTLTLGEGRLAPGEQVSYEVYGAGGPPSLREARWIIDGRVGTPLGPDEASLR